jgi:hypothetical protein
MTALTTAPTGAVTDGHAPQRPEYSGTLEVWKPPTDDVGGVFDLRIEDPDGIQPYNIIKSKHPVKVVCDIWLTGDIWKCVCGWFCCEVWFERASDGTRFSLSDLIGGELRERFVGCKHVDKETGKVRFTLSHDVPGEKFLGNSEKPDVLEAKASVSFLNECKERGTVTGFDHTHIQVYAHH